MTNTPDNEVALADVAKMIELLREGGWREATLRMGDFELHVSDGAASTTPAPRGTADSAPAVSAPAPATTPAPAAPVPAAPAPVDSSKQTVVRAQSLGMFWRSPQPGAPAFVEVGDEVSEDSPLGIIEVMKMMTRVVPGVRGVVSAIHVENGQMVEFDEPLLTITLA
jgi:acetyl-CoA carboxylase biotin carboxyl carrier protein